jgi:protein involved in polysaccharide export with SLBB domain
VLPSSQTGAESTDTPESSRPDIGTDTGTATSSAIANDSKDTEQTSLTAPQIIAIARGNPEVMLELKSYLADWLQARGTPAQADSISDEQVYSQIASSSQVRAGITMFLRARGYVSEADIPSAAATSAIGASAKTDAALQGGIVRSPSDDQLRASGLEDWKLLDQYPGILHARNSEQQSRGNDAADSRQSSPVTPNITDAPSVLHRAAPYNLLSLRDLYTQIPDSPEHLKRFGAQVFLRNGASPDTSRPGVAGNTSALDVPLGPDYVLGAGDELSISLWGGLSQTFTRTINREGTVTLPEAGQVQLAGLTLAKAQDVVEGALQPQFRSAHVAVTVARLRTIRIYVVGDVQRPGAYDVTSLASPLSALSAAGGPTAIGSLRVMRQIRDGKLVGNIDLYDFLLNGIRKSDDRLEAGDTLLVPPAGPQVAVHGAVKRPAIYELRGERNLAEALEDAGGLTVAAELGHITIERIQADDHREIISVDSAKAGHPAEEENLLAKTELQDGDRVRVATVLPYTERVVYLQGHVARPGKLAYRDGLRVADVLKSYRDVLPEPAARGEIVRLVAPDLHPETFQFNVYDVLAGNSNPALQPFDTIRVFGRYEQDTPDVTVKGEVMRPGLYPMFDGMTAAQLVRAAGGFKRDAWLSDADLISYAAAGNTGVAIAHRSIRIGDAVNQNDAAADVALKPGDVLTVLQLTGWNDIGASITIEGEIAHPGSYGFKEGEHLSDVLKRAGGFRSTAYPEGAVLTRPEVQALEQKSRDELIRQIETSSAAARLSPKAGGADQSATLQQIQQQQDQVISRLRSQPASGRLVIHISAGIDSWAGTSADVEVRNGDVLRVPKRPGFVLISGQVYNASAITFVPGESASWYLERAGGATQIASRKDIFIIRANGSVVGRRSGVFGAYDVLSTRLEPGDVIVVPQKIIGASVLWRNILGTAQFAASLAIAAAVAGI